MNSRMIDIIIELFIAFKAKVLNVFDFDLMDVEQMICSFDFSGKLEIAIVAWISVESFLLRHSAVVINVLLQLCTGFEMNRTLWTGIPRASIDRDEILLDFQILLVPFLMLIT